MRKIFTLLVCLFCAFSVSAEDVKNEYALIQNVMGRKTMSLDGEWNYIVDPYGHGLGSRYYMDKTFDGNSLADYDFGTSPTLQVPGDWDTQKPELFYYEGKVWYRRVFDYHMTEGHYLYLRFGAANYKAQVWLNGKELGRHEGGFTPFEFEITNKVKDKGNSLVVCVDNTRLTDGIPTMNTDWWNYGGLCRSVILVETDDVFVKDYLFEYSEGKKNMISLKLWLNKKVAGKKVTMGVPELKIKKVLTTDSMGMASIEVKANPMLWSPENPKLYDVKITLGNETIKDRIGFRTIKTEGNKILLNGKQVFLCGVNIHEESVGDSHRCRNREEDSLLLSMAKQLGCNFVRLAHYPHNEEMVRLADEMGLMVWSEIPLYWGIDWRNQKTYTLAEQQLTEMIGRDKNRCSVIIWSIANETAVNKERTAFLTKLANEARRQDGTRLISAALQNVNKRLSKFIYTVEDPLKDALDIFSFNEYIGWYDADKKYCDSITWQLDTDKPVVISEFGGGARIGRHSGKSAFFSEDNMVELYRHQFRMLRKIPGLAGTIPWVLKDFRSPHRALEGIQDGFNRKGLYSDKGEKKAAWQVVKTWNDEHRSSAEFWNQHAQATIPTENIMLSDPFILADSKTKTYYMTGTGGRMWKSKDLKRWEGPFDVIQTDPNSWMGPRPMVWAAELHQYKGRYYYFATFTNRSVMIDTVKGTPIERRACHVLVSDKPDGPYTPMKDKEYLPANQPTLDANFWVDKDGEPYMIFCHEWLQNWNGTVEKIRMKPDLGGTYEESRQLLFRAFDSPWSREKDKDGNIIPNKVTDGPFVFRTKTGRLGMIWTSWRFSDYTQGVAYSQSGTLDGPWIQQQEPITPPNYGHGMIFRTFDGQLLLCCHSHANINGRTVRKPAFFKVDDSADEIKVTGLIDINNQ